jgi:hypothetical protein
MFGAKLNNEVSFYIGSQRISGVNSIDISYSNDAQIIKPLGYSQGVTVHNNDSKKNISISRDFILSKDALDSRDYFIDRFLDYTTTKIVSGAIDYENKSYIFDGYMTNYSVNFAVGSPPKSNVNIVAYTAMFSGANPSRSPSIYDLTLQPPKQGDISIVCDNYSSNRVIGFDYSITSNKKPIYSIGSTSPSIVEFIPPLEYSATVQIEVDDAFMQNSQYFLTNKQNKNVYLSVYNEEKTLEIIRFSVPKASLVSEQLSASADGVLKLTLSYIGHS